MDAQGSEDYVSEYTKEFVVGEEVALKVEEFKRIIGQVIKNFVATEAGNKVTPNNMLGLTVIIGQVLDGEITLTNEPQ